MDCGSLGSSVNGILQARILECVAISFSRGSFRQGIKPGSPLLQVDSLPLGHLSSVQFSCSFVSNSFGPCGLRHARLLCPLPTASHGGGGLVAKSCLTIATPWTVACQALLSMGFSRKEYWSGLPFPSLEDLPHPRIKPAYPALAGRLVHKHTK